MACTTDSCVVGTMGLVAAGVEPSDRTSGRKLAQANLMSEEQPQGCLDAKVTGFYLLQELVLCK